MSKSISEVIPGIISEENLLKVPEITNLVGIPEKISEGIPGESPGQSFS